jgi:hypothetical protein
MTDPKDLVRVYRAANAPDAYLVKNLLANEGIDAMVSEVVEPLPGTVDPPEVFVRQEDLPRARLLVEEYDRRQIERAERPDWQCPKCSAEVVGAFDECDVCGAYRPGAEPSTEESSEP